MKKCVSIQSNQERWRGGRKAKATYVSVVGSNGGLCVILVQPGEEDCIHRVTLTDEAGVQGIRVGIQERDIGHAGDVDVLLRREGQRGIGRERQLVPSRPDLDGLGGDGPGGIQGERRREAVGEGRIAGDVANVAGVLRFNAEDAVHSHHKSVQVVIITIQGEPLLYDRLSTCLGLGRTLLHLGVVVEREDSGSSAREG